MLTSSLIPVATDPDTYISIIIIIVIKMNTDTAKKDTSFNTSNMYSTINRPPTPYPASNTTSYSVTSFQYYSLPNKNEVFHSFLVISVPLVRLYRR